MVACNTSKKNIFFTTQDLKGNYVYGDDIFKQNKVTVVNIWATWCGPCVGELQSLQKLYKTYNPQGVEFIGICVDSPPNTAKIQQLLNEKGVKYPIVLGNAETDEIFQTKYIPATFFIDSNGDMVGDPVIGADVQAYTQRIEEMLKK